MIKVLSLSESDTWGGAARAAYRIHQGVRQLGVDARMLVVNKQSKGSDVMALADFVPDNLFYKAFDWTRNKVQNRIQHARWGRYPNRDKVFMSDLRGTDLRGLLKRLDYDVLHLHWINLRFVPLKDLPKNKPIVWTLHDSWPFCGVCHYPLECEGWREQCGRCPLLHSINENDLSHKIWLKKKQVYNSRDLHIVTPSQWLASQVKESGLLSQFPVTVIPNCLETDVFSPVQTMEIPSRFSHLESIKGCKSLVLYGAMNATTDQRKGFAHLQAALHYLQTQGKTDQFELIVFGAKAGELKMELNMPVHYVGYIGSQQDLAALYRLANVMVVPSVAETFGQTASEALACGTPVVAFRCTGIQEVVSHHMDGYLAEPYDDEDLANGILWCLENNTNNQLGLVGREKALNEYNVKTICTKYKQLYEGLL